jgi:hypothetical protein
MASDSGQDKAANKRITDALVTRDAQPGPGDEGDDDNHASLSERSCPCLGAGPDAGRVP